MPNGGSPAIPILPQFSKPGEYLRYVGPSASDPQRDPEAKVRYVRLLDREFPLKYPLIFNDLTSGSKSDIFTFDELDPAANHIFELYLGVQGGFRTQIWHPFDERLLRFDQRIIKIPEEETSNVTIDDTPYNAPVISLWVAPGKRFPGLIFENITKRVVQGGKTIKPSIIWVMAKFRWLDVTPDRFPDVHEALESLRLPSKSMSFGRRI